MFYFSLFFLELTVLFLLSRTLTRVIAQFVYRLTKNKTAAISTIALLFLPGTAIHELSHALLAGLLGVPVGTMEFMPVIDGETVKLGSVQIGKTDPIRRFFIGSAPFIFGTVLLLAILFFALQYRLFDNRLYVIFIGYLVFEIGNTMFSSKKDMEGALELFGAIIFLLIVLSVLGIPLSWLNPERLLSQPIIQEIFRRGSFFLFIPLAIDILVILLFRLFKK